MFSFEKKLVMKYYFILFPLLFFSCHTTRITVLDGTVIDTETVIRLNKNIDTIEYITLWNGDVITKKEFNKRWDDSVNKTTREIKKRIKQGN